MRGDKPHSYTTQGGYGKVYCETRPGRELNDRERSGVKTRNLHSDGELSKGWCSYSVIVRGARWI